MRALIAINIFNIIMLKVNIVGVSHRLLKKHIFSPLLLLPFNKKSDFYLQHKYLRKKYELMTY